jgi:thymidine kinase
VCGAPANRTYRKAHDMDERVVVGGAELYEARCRFCFNSQAPTPVDAPEPRARVAGR